MDMLLAKAGPRREVGNDSVMTYLRGKSKQSGYSFFLAREEEKVRTKQHGDTKISGEGGGDSTAAHGFMGHAEIHGDPQGCRDPPPAHGRGAYAGGGGCLEESVIRWETRWRDRGGPASRDRLEQPVLGGLHPTERDPHCSSFGRAVCLWEGYMLQQFWKDCCL
ncbi:hypothetical protein HGM15179_002171 [Zosterops borbonicus]|uniref:Uncharacterized protein n=1 Tax=Zosterops borbonicus TaxID=364589 RepID=A0A8K1LS98_9PASS|nr:hypothetical protein HGM15179_002171 [Zosterops borbonicus]